MPAEAPVAEQAATTPGSEQPPAKPAEQVSAPAPAAAAAPAPAGTTDGAAPATAKPAAGDAQTTAPSDVTFPDFENDAAVEAFLARNPKLTGYVTKVRADAANQAVQRAQNEATRRYADEQYVNEAVQSVLDSRADEAQKAQRIAGIHALARRAAGLEFANRLFETSLSGFEVPVEAREQAALAWARLDPASGDPDPDYDGWLRHTVEGATQARLGTLKLDQVPQGSPLRGEIDQLVASRVEAELRAKGVAVAAEGAPKTGPAGTRSEGPTLNHTIAEAKSLRPEDVQDWSEEDVKNYLRTVQAAAR